MTIEEQLSDARAQLAAALATAATLQADLDVTRASATAAIQERDQLSADLTTARASIASLTSERDTAIAERNTLADAASKYGTELEEARNATAQKVNAEAVRIAAAQGAPPLSASAATPAEPSTPKAEGRTKATWGRDFTKKQ